MRDAGGGSSDPELEAILAIERGDRGRALDLLMTAYGRMVYRYCCRILVDADLAGDVLQTTFLQAFEDLERFDGRSSLRTWLFGISHHRCLDALKARRRRQHRFEGLDATRPIVDPSVGVEEAAAASQRRRALIACLEELDTRIREAIQLRYELGLSYPEIAAIVNERPPTLQARVARALPVLRRCLDLKGVGA
jgi:RNA polymerase sigma-70 factor (ECF subfamily)